jgi:CBS domain-containing protein
MRVRDAMTPAPAICDPSTPIRHAAELMSDRDCAAVPVTDSGRVVGIITDRDIACRAIARFENAPAMPVLRFMSCPVLTVAPEDPIEKAIALMEENAIHHLPVIDGAGMLLGIVAQSDLGRRMTNREFGRMARSTSIRSRAVYVRNDALVRKEQ